MRKKAFSIAEAMITLLIVSIALAAMAPIFSKRADQTNSTANVEVIPEGAIMMFDKVSKYSTNGGCPPQWTKVNMDGRYPRITTNFNAIGVTMDGGLPNVTGYLGKNNDFGFATNGSYNLWGAFYADTSYRLPYRAEGHNSTFSYNVGFDASRSNGIYGRAEEVRPNSVLYVACRKN